MTITFEVDMMEKNYSLSLKNVWRLLGAKTLKNGDIIKYVIRIDVKKEYLPKAEELGNFLEFFCG